MTDTTASMYDRWRDSDLYDSAGEKVGSIQDIYYDDASRRPEWVAVRAGLFKGTRFVPIQGSSTDADGNLRAAFDVERIKQAPDIDTDDGHLTEGQERELYRHYGFSYDYDRTDTRIGQDYGYGKSYATSKRADKDYEVHDQDEVEVPVEAKVRLRKYVTQKQATRTVEVPVTETEEHVEVADTDVNVRGDRS